MGRIIQLVRAKTAANKLEVMDNRPFSIVQVCLLDLRGFEVTFMDLITGEIRVAAYQDRIAFEKEWKHCSGIYDEDFKSFEKRRCLYME